MFGIKSIIVSFGRRWLLNPRLFFALGMALAHTGRTSLARMSEQIVRTALPHSFAVMVTVAMGNFDLENRREDTKMAISG